MSEATKGDRLEGAHVLEQARLHGPSVPSLASHERPRSLWSDAWRQFRRHRLALAGLFTLASIVLAVIAGPELIPYDPERIDFRAKSSPPTLAHPMGTDELGRDQLVRVLDGGRVSLAVGLAVVLVAMSVGVAIGAIAGYAGGWVDNALMRVVDVFYSMPGLFVIILLVTLLGPNFWTIVISLGLLRWMTTARLVRASFLSLKEQEFVEAARAIGASNVRIVLRHILPNALSPIIVAATLGIAGAILAESALSFLGLGFQPPQATWGRMLEEAQKMVIHEGHWWRGFFPGLMIFLTIISINFVGDGLRDALDPRRLERS
ncbi:ABC transporter permease [Thermomicrobiaceae bacterium CFH 74404]|uniref:ABC transporter permease n=1 Tax=Thermalbibacter longus TaxID=2951981 RepID=A0AA41WDQ5_9BACT|nr:oligopeptide ABC transporter permease [Thermalbibacter longus]MCM8748160.1 ABC transporter permease [Thermalbibacter longus]